MGAPRRLKRVMAPMRIEQMVPGLGLWHLGPGDLWRMGPGDRWNRELPVNRAAWPSPGSSAREALEHVAAPPSTGPW